MLRWLPNALTLLRLALIPAWWMHATWCADAVRSGADGASHRIVAVVVLGAIGLSDVLDGFLARRLQVVTRLGAVLDALADKLAQVGLLVFFARSDGEAFERVPLPFLVLVLGSDALLATGSYLIRQRRGRVAVVHRPHGKLTSLLLFLLLVALTAGVPRAFTAPAWWIIGGVVAVSTAAYFRDGWRQWREELEPPVTTRRTSIIIRREPRRRWRRRLASFRRRVEPPGPG